ncbi:MAG: dipicolinate synthase subunit B [Ruminiclostridium sp.]|nr:dipicolinate synthase subunit B [Ruminiclostridium sp.]
MQLSGNISAKEAAQKPEGEQVGLPFEGLRIGVAVCGSFCTFKKVFETTERLRAMGAEIIPIMSFNAASISSRFGKAEENLALFERLAGRKAIITIEDAEPIGPKKMTDVMLLPNCTGNTMAKLAMSITDTPVTMAVKSHLRGGRPVIVNVATNDALSGSAKNIGALMNLRHYYFVPLRQDDHRKKPTSVVGDFSLIPETIISALKGVQLQAVLREPQSDL